MDKQNIMKYHLALNVSRHHFKKVLKPLHTWTHFKYDIHFLLSLKLICLPKPCEGALRKPLQEIRCQAKGFQITLDFLFREFADLTSVLSGLLPEAGAEGAQKRSTGAHSLGQRLDHWKVTGRTSQEYI